MMMDETGAKFNGLVNVFGKKWMDDKCIACQWHFQTNLQEHKHEIKENLRDESLQLGNELCRVPGVAEFDLIFARMQEIVSKSWELSGLTLYEEGESGLSEKPLHSGASNAEICNAQWKPQHKLSLVAAVKDDNNKMMQLEANYKLFQEGESF